MADLETLTNLYWRLHDLSKMLEGSDRIDGMEHRDAYPTILDAMGMVYEFKVILEKSTVEVPINMMLYCPNCGARHIDTPEAGRELWGNNFETPIVEVGGWTNPPHRSHLCSNCGTVWRPADVPTNGVLDIETKGKSDTWPTNSLEANYSMPGENRTSLGRLAALQAISEELLAIHKRTQERARRLGLPSAEDDPG